MSVNKIPGVVVGGNEPRRPSLKSLFAKTGIKYAIIIFAVAAAIIGGSYYYFALNNDGSTAAKMPPRPKISPSSAPSDPLKPVDVSYVQLNDDELTSRVNFLMGTNQYAEAEKLISMQNDLSRNKTKLGLLVTVQEALGKNAEAAATAKRIESAGTLTPGEYMILARQAEAAGDKPEAIRYYKMAIDVYNREKQGAYESEVQLLEAKIADLR